MGIPLFSGFISKLLFAQAAVQSQGKALAALVVLAVSSHIGQEGLSILIFNYGEQHDTCQNRKHYGKQQNMIHIFFSFIAIW